MKAAIPAAAAALIPLTGLQAQDHDAHHSHSGPEAEAPRNAANHAHYGHGSAIQHHAHGGVHARAPVGVMGDHVAPKGSWMVSYRVMHMDMSGVQMGTKNVDPDTIVTTVPNRFAGMPMQPPTLRIVPTDMRMDMHMAGIMYGLSNRLTLMAMANYLTKEMDHVTYQGGMGTNQLGTFRTSPAGLGDTKLAALIGITHNVHLNAGISIPTGSISETDDILTPMGAAPTVRLPYPMQLGSGTWDLEPGITWRGQSEDWGWGAQVKGVVHLGENSAGYAHGNSAMATAWLARSLTQGVAFSGRLQAEAKGDIDGTDAQVMGPVQTANPDFHGGQSVTGYVGLNIVPANSWRLGVEFGLPLVQNLNGPQMPVDWTLTFGVQKRL